MSDKSPATTPVGPSVETVPEGDNRTRLVCPDCGYIEYTNPKVVVGAVCLWGDRVLLCRRAIDPQRGLWTIPAGFMEVGETTAEGAAREVWEEALARVSVQGLIGIYEIPRISQVQMLYRARMLGPECGAGEESLEVVLVPWADIPWDDLAFPSVTWALRQVLDGAADGAHAAAGRPDQAPWSGEPWAPSELSTDR
ncbi:MAG: NUDIX domain-containing protein [Rhodospirillales bacterium]|nr:MAG: NUDIX domain-containing protein [Rhodospirillales bacterium]